MSGTLHSRRASAVPTAAALLHARGTTSIGAFIVDGETALQLTQRRATAARAQSFIASALRS